MEIIISVISGFLVGALITFLYQQNKYENKIVKIEDKRDKFLAYFKLMCMWMEIENPTGDLKRYIEKSEMRTIAIYGIGRMGQRLCVELQDSNVEIKYIIDQNKNKQYRNYAMCSLEDKLETVDAVVVTLTHDFDEIEQQLKKKIDCPIISLEELIYEVV